MPSRQRRGVALSKREAVLSAAAELMLAGGYDNTSMDAVAASAGVSKTTVYAHFSDKDELFKAVMAQAATEFAEHLDAALQRAKGTEPAERLATAFVEIVRAGIAPQLLSFYRVLITETERRTQLTAGMEEVMTGVPDVTQMLAKLIQDHATQRGFEIERPEQFATLMLRIITSGLQLDMLLSDFQPSPALLEDHVRYVVGMILRGIEPRDGAPRAELPAGYDYPWGPALNRPPRG